MKPTLTQDVLKARVHYDPDTGVFTSLFTGRPLIMKGADGYLIVRIGDFACAQHRLAFLYVTGAWPKNVVDHINRERRDNRWANLRDVTIKHNLQNVTQARKNSKTGLLGAYKSATPGRYFSQIETAGKIRKLGSFTTAEAAHLAYLSAKTKLHKGFVS